MSKKNPSDSTIQQRTETELVQILGKRIGCKLLSHSIRLNTKSKVQIDGFSNEGRIICEAYAHVGALKPGHLHKLATDILKLNLVASRLGGKGGKKWRKILLVADEAACKYLEGSSWVAEARRQSDVEIIVADISMELKRKIISAQGKQKMVNA